MIFKKYRYDYFLIWGHGMLFQNEIISIIENVPEFMILKEINYEAKKIDKLVKKVYSYDYAPFHHLKSKTKYLKHTQSRVKFIFIKNNFPIENHYGNGRFFHIECDRIKKTKEKIRNEFNERKHDRRIEDHVVHASDNESQTDYILKYLGYKLGTKTFDRNLDKIINAPHHLKIPNNYSVKKISMDLLLCSIIENDKTKVVPIEESPQFKGGKYYEDYLLKNNGKHLQDGYSISKFKLLTKQIEYLKDEYSTDYIITKRLNEKFLVLDGLHRAAIQKKNGMEAIKIVII